MGVGRCLAKAVGRPLSRVPHPCSLVQGVKGRIPRTREQGRQGLHSPWSAAALSFSPPSHSADPFGASPPSPAGMGTPAEGSVLGLLLGGLPPAPRCGFPGIVPRLVVILQRLQHHLFKAVLSAML